MGNYQLESEPPPPDDPPPKSLDELLKELSLELDELEDEDELLELWLLAMVVEGGGSRGMLRCSE